MSSSWVEFEHEVNVLCRGFVAAYGREAAPRAVLLEPPAPAARRVLEEVARRLGRDAST